MKELINLESDKIILDNGLVESHIGGLTLNSLKLLMFLCTEKSMRNLVERDIGYQLDFKNSDFLESIGYTSEKGFHEVKKYIKQLRNTTIEIPIWSKNKLAGATITGFIMEAETYKRGVTTVSISKALMPYLHVLVVESDKTIFKYNIQKSFESTYSSRIYLLLYRWKNTKLKTVTISIEDLKLKLGIKGKYPSYKDLNRWVLQVAEKEINSKSDIIMTYKSISTSEEKVRGRRPITHIQFNFEMKEIVPIATELSEIQITELLEIAGKRAAGSNKTALQFYKYAYDLALDGCNSKTAKAYYKYMLQIFEKDSVFLGQMSMFDKAKAIDKKSYAAKVARSAAQRKLNEDAYDRENETFMEEQIRKRKNKETGLSEIMQEISIKFKLEPVQEYDPETESDYGEIFKTLDYNQEVLEDVDKK